MSVTAVVGAQWGDEGKGRVVDYLAADADLVIRYGGGNNAGHTVVNPHGHFKLHLIPSGIFRPATRNLLGNGVVINPPALVTELDGLDAAGIGCDNLLISDRAHLVMPYHVLLDRLEERERGRQARHHLRGIGPAYVDKVARRGIRVIDLMEPAAFRERLDAALPCPPDRGGLLRRRPGARCAHRRGHGLRNGSPRPTLPPASGWPRTSSTAWQWWTRRSTGDRMLLEGQLGTMRDIDWGTYPFVTSSSPIPGGASLGAGMPAVPSTACWAWRRPTSRPSAAGRCRPSLRCGGRASCASAASSTAPRPAVRGGAAGTTRWRCASACGWPATRALR